MINIGKPKVWIVGEKAILKAPVSISADTVSAYMELSKSMRKVHWRVSENYPPKEWKQEGAGLFFSVDKEYSDYLCFETADAFVVAMLWYAMTTGSDIYSEAPVSADLLFSVNNYLIPALCTEKNGLKRIKVEAQRTKKLFRFAEGVGTGMSCGIDSLYSLQKYSRCDDNEKQLTHLTYFNMGAIFHPDSSSKKQYTIEEFYNETDKMSEEKLKQAVDVANKAKLPLIYVSSNLDSDYYRGAYGYTAVYRNCACVLALQKLFKTYYCSSAGWPGFLDYSLDEGSEHYEDILCQCFSTENCKFILSDYVSRIEKTKSIAEWDIAWNYLDVCFNFHNCGHCAKCYRVLLTLDILGVLDNFSAVFDIDSFRKNRAKAVGWLLYTKEANKKDDNGIFARDIFDFAMSNHYIIPKGAYREYMKLKLRRMKKQFRKAIKSIGV